MAGVDLCLGILSGEDLICFSTSRSLYLIFFQQFGTLSPSPFLTGGGRDTLKMVFLMQHLHVISFSLVTSLEIAWSHYISLLFLVSSVAGPSSKVIILSQKQLQDMIPTRENLLKTGDHSFGLETVSWQICGKFLSFLGMARKFYYIFGPIVV